MGPRLSRSGKKCAECLCTPATAKCRRCKRNFCTGDFNKHQQQVDQQLKALDESLKSVNDELQKFSATAGDHQLLQEINEWEKESRLRIEDRAKNIKSSILANEDLQRAMRRLGGSVRRVTNEINKNKREDRRLEPKIKRWEQELNNLSQEIKEPIRTELIYKSKERIEFPTLKITARRKCFCKAKQVSPPVRRTKRWPCAWMSRRVRRKSSIDPFDRRQFLEFNAFEAMERWTQQHRNSRSW